MRPIDIAVHNALVPGSIDEPDLVVWRFGKITLVANRHREVMGLHTFGNNRLLAIRRVGDDPLAVVLARVQPAIGPEREAMRASAGLPPNCDLAVGIELMNPIVSGVSEIDVAFLVHGGIGGELVSLSEQLPVRARRQNGIHSAVNDFLRLNNGLWVILPDPT